MVPYEEFHIFTIHFEPPKRGPPLYKGQNWSFIWRFHCILYSINTRYDISVIYYLLVTAFRLHCFSIASNIIITDSISASNSSITSTSVSITIISTSSNSTSISSQLYIGGILRMKW